MSHSTLLSPASQSLVGRFALPASKSEANRTLIIQALSETPVELDNLSEARDTQTLQRILNTRPAIWDVQDAGTAMRFLTAFAAATQQAVTLQGTARMHQRPIAPLVDALRQLGYRVDYQGQAGYPPLRINPGLADTPNARLSIPGHISSQFISAVLLVAPYRRQELQLDITGRMGSAPYIDLTIALMRHFGARVERQGQTVSVAAQPYTGGAYRIESDWSAASYAFSLVALHPGSSLLLPGLRPDSWQGDAVLPTWYERLGVACRWTADGLELRHTGRVVSHLELDFTDQPDLAQTVLCTCAGLEIPARASGLESLLIKETDRVAALRNELGKLGFTLQTPEPGTVELRGTWQATEADINTYEDHRMAMAFAPLIARLDRLTISDGAAVVRKSFPRFWEVLAAVGIPVQESAS